MCVAARVVTCSCTSLTEGWPSPGWSVVFEVTVVVTAVASPVCRTLRTLVVTAPELALTKLGICSCWWLVVLAEAFDRISAT